MSGLRTLVCVKVVPRPEEVKVNPATHTLDRVNARSMINPPDMNALEIALDLKGRHGGTVGVVTMGPRFFEEYLKLALLMGADAGIVLSDRAFAGADTLATSYVLARGIARAGGADLVLCGEESSDGATGQVPQGIAEWLEASQITNAVTLAFRPEDRKIEAKRELAGGWEVVRSAVPVVVAVRSGANEPRFPDFGLRASVPAGAISVWDAAALETDAALIGMAGSPTSAVKLKELPRRDRKREMIPGAPDSAARELVGRLKPHL